MSTLVGKIILNYIYIYITCIGPKEIFKEIRIFNLPIYLTYLPFRAAMSKQSR